MTTVAETAQTPGFFQRARNLVFGERVIDASNASGAFSAYSTNSVTHYKVNDLKAYFDAYINHDLCRMYVDDLAEAAVGLGFYLTTDEDYPPTVDKQGKETPDPKDPKPLINEFNKHFDLDNLMPNIQKISLIAGWCLVETKIVKEVEKCSLKIIHPLTIDFGKNKGIEVEDGKVVAVHQKVNKKTNVVKATGWDEAHKVYTTIVVFPYDQIGNSPLGISYIRGMIDLINTLIRTTQDVERILKRYLAPLGIWKMRGDTENVKIAVTSRNPGEDIYLGQLRQEEVDNPNFPQFFSIDPRVPFWEYIEYIDRRIYAYSRANNIWYLRNATEASAKQVGEVVDRHVHSIQRSAKRVIETEWYTPLIELNKLEEVPKINFGVEDTGIENVDISNFLEKMLELGYLDDKQSLSIVKQAGLNIPDREEVPDTDTEQKSETPTQTELPPEEMLREGITYLQKGVKRDGEIINIIE